MEQQRPAVQATGAGSTSHTLPAALAASSGALVTAAATPPAADMETDAGGEAVLAGPRPSAPTPALAAAAPCPALKQSSAGPVESPAHSTPAPLPSESLSAASGLVAALDAGAPAAVPLPAAPPHEHVAPEQPRVPQLVPAEGKEVGGGAAADLIPALPKKHSGGAKFPLAHAKPAAASAAGAGPSAAAKAGKPPRPAPAPKPGVPAQGATALPPGPKPAGTPFNFLQTPGPSSGSGSGSSSTGLAASTPPAITPLAGFGGVPPAKAASQARQLSRLGPAAAAAGGTANLLGAAPAPVPAAANSAAKLFGGRAVGFPAKSATVPAPVRPNPEPVAGAISAAHPAAGAAAKHPGLAPAPFALGAAVHPAPVCTAAAVAAASPLLPSSLDPTSAAATAAAAPPHAPPAPKPTPSAAAAAATGPAGPTPLTYPEDDEFLALGFGCGCLEDHQARAKESRALCSSVVQGCAQQQLRADQVPAGPPSWAVQREALCCSSCLGLLPGGCCTKGSV